jgi:hypothetical protein
MSERLKMTISPEEQLQNVDLALRLVLTELGDGAIFETFFDPRSDSYKVILATTWKELCDQRWLEERELYGYPHYRFTGSGWVEALWKTGAGEGLELQESSGKLARALKVNVKGRREDVIVESSSQYSAPRRFPSGNLAPHPLQVPGACASTPSRHSREYHSPDSSLNVKRTQPNTCPHLSQTSLTQIPYRSRISVCCSAGSFILFFSYAHTSALICGIVAYRSRLTYSLILSGIA